jgi:PTH1 family peptidyl-tRNA hydrolase
MKLIVGLGNPGSAYKDTRHNAGQMVVWALGARHGLQWEPDVRRKRAQARWLSGRTVVRLLYPLTMMNESGPAVAAAVSFWKVASADLLIVCDDVNLPLGTLRLRPQGSDGGHHGLASCLEHLGTHEVPRLRVGVGVQPLPKDLTDFVLSPFRREERTPLTRIIERAAEACEAWATQGIKVAMNTVNTRVASSI